MGESSSEDFLIVVVGNSGAGKTTLINKYANNTFTEDRAPTVSADYTSVEREYDGRRYKMQLWDTVGDKYNGATTFILKRPSVGAYILVFNQGDEESFDDIKAWEEKLPSDKVRVIVGTHADLPVKVTEEQIKGKLKICGGEFATDPKYFSVSSVTGANVNEVFEAIMKVLIRKRTGKKPASGSVDPSQPSQTKKGGGGCLIL